MAAAVSSAKAGCAARTSRTCWKRLSGERAKAPEAKKSRASAVERAFTRSGPLWRESLYAPRTGMLSPSLIRTRVDSVPELSKLNEPSAPIAVALRATTCSVASERVEPGGSSTTPFVGPGRRAFRRASRRPQTGAGRVATLGGGAALTGIASLAPGVEAAVAAGRLQCMEAMRLRLLRLHRPLHLAALRSRDPRGEGDLLERRAGLGAAWMPVNFLDALMDALAHPPAMEIDLEASAIASTGDPAAPPMKRSALDDQVARGGARRRFGSTLPLPTRPEAGGRRWR